MRRGRKYGTTKQARNQTPAGLNHRYLNKQIHARRGKRVGFKKRGI